MKNPLKLLFLATLVFWSLTTGYGQTLNVDSLLDVAESVDDSSRVCIYITLARHYQLTSIVESLKYAEMAYALSKENNMIWGMAEAENRMGNVYYFLADYIKALDYYFKSLEKRELIGDQYGVAGSYNNIALIYLEYQNYPRAIEYIEKSLSIHEDDLEGKAINLNNLGVIYAELKDSAKALEYCRQTLEIHEQLNNPEGKADVNNNIADLYKEFHVLDKARKYQEDALRIYEQSGNTSGIAFSKLNLGEILLLENKLDEGYVQLTEALPIARKLMARELLSSIHKHLSEYYEYTQDPKNALEQFELYTTYQDTIFEQSSDEQTLELQMKFDTENQFREIEVLSMDKKLHQIQFRKQKNLGIFLILIAGISFGLIILINIIIQFRNTAGQLTREKNVELFYSNKELKQTETELRNLNQAKDKFFSIIAHDLISPFNSFLGLSEVLFTNIQTLTVEETRKYASWIFSSATNLYNLVEDLLQWSQAQTGKLNYLPKEMLLIESVDSVYSLMEPQAREKNIQISHNIQKDLKIYADANIILTVLRNLVGNAIKFSKPDGIISIGGTLKEDMVVVSVSDKGVGIEKEMQSKLFQLDHSCSTKGTADEVGTGLGLILCHEFVEVMGGEIEVESDIGKGSTFRFTVPNMARKTDK